MSKLDMSLVACAMLIFAAFVIIQIIRGRRGGGDK